MNTNTKWIISLIAVGFLLVIVAMTRVSYNNSAADAEVLVIQAKDDCASVYDNGIKSVIEMASVDQNTKTFLKGMVDNGTLSQDPKVQQAYSEFVNGSPAQLMFLLGGISGTNFTATAENVQREISAQRSSMLTCSTRLNSTQAELKKVVGMDASGRVVKWPQSWMGLNYPSPVSDGSLRDNDSDGRLTVLDYRPPVNIDIRESFGTGEGIPPVILYPTP